MKKRILLIGGNYFPEPTGIGKYSGEMMKWLAGEGHDCTVVTTYPYYPQWKVQPPYEKKRFWYTWEKIEVGENAAINVIRCPHYVPKSPSGLTRSISEFSFFFTAYLIVLLLLFKKKFDNVITVAPPFAIGLLGIFYKRIRGGKFVYHIQDLQVDAAKDLAMIKSNMVINLFFLLEKFIIKNADAVSTISPGMIKKVKGKCNREVLLFPNWADIEAFHPISNKAELKYNFGFNPTDKVVLYAGAIGHKQGLEAILHAAKTLESLRDIKFAICGSGPYKEQLVKLKEEMNLKNVVFLPLQPLATFNMFLNMADLHLVLQKAGASDLVLPSKLSGILSVGGVAIVTANEGTSLHNIMSASNMGLLIEPENQDELVGAISSILENNYCEKSQNARAYAEQNLSSDKILRTFFTEVFGYESRTIKRPIRKVISQRIESIG